MAARRARPPDAARPPVRTRRRRVSTRRAATRLALRDRFALRRAVVQMTILGPCRALTPYEWPEGAGAVDAIDLRRPTPMWRPPILSTFVGAPTDIAIQLI